MQKQRLGEVLQILPLAYSSPDKREINPFIKACIPSKPKQKIDMHHTLSLYPITSQIEDNTITLILC